MKQKIAFIASYPHSLINFRLALMKDFIARGYDVIAIAPFDSDVSIALSKHNIRLIPVAMERNGINPLQDIILMRHLYKILKIENADVVFCYTIKPIIYGSFAAKLARVPKIVSMITGTGYVFLDINLKSKIIGLIARTLFRFSLHFNTLIYFQNPDNLAYFRKLKIISSEKNTVVINGSGVDCDHYVPAQYPQAVSFLMIARLLYDKGVREYVSAAKRLKKNYPEVKFRLIGWIDTNPNSISQSELDNWVNEGVIEYLGKLSDVRPAIQDASVYVLPSYHEGTPRTVLEAMAMARPIITTDAPGCKETVIQGKNGYLVPVKDVDSLCESMEQFILKPELTAMMGNESRKYALDKYDVNKVNQSIIAVI